MGKLASLHCVFSLFRKRTASSQCRDDLSLLANSQETKPEPPSSENGEEPLVKSPHKNKGKKDKKKSVVATEVAVKEEPPETPRKKEKKKSKKALAAEKASLQDSLIQNMLASFGGEKKKK